MLQILLNVSTKFFCRHIDACSLPGGISCRPSRQHLFQPTLRPLELTPNDQSHCLYLNARFSFLRTRVVHLVPTTEEDAQTLYGQSTVSCPPKVPAIQHSGTHIWTALVVIVPSTWLVPRQQNGRKLQCEGLSADNCQS